MKSPPGDVLFTLAGGLDGEGLGNFPSIVGQRTIKLEGPGILCNNWIEAQYFLEALEASPLVSARSGIVLEYHSRPVCFGQDTSRRLRVDAVLEGNEEEHFFHQDGFTDAFERFLYFFLTRLHFHWAAVDRGSWTERFLNVLVEGLLSWPRSRHILSGWGEPFHDGCLCGTTNLVVDLHISRPERVENYTEQNGDDRPCPGDDRQNDFYPSVHVPPLCEELVSSHCLTNL